MRELKIGERIPVEAGGEAIVSRELGRGGQGIVYLVRYNGREYALKWYFISRIKNPEAFRNNLQKNIEDGAPDGGRQFIWPLFLTQQKKNGAFGYLMRLAPAGYDSFTDIYNGYKWEKPAAKGRPARKRKVKFASLDVMITAAINIVKAFRSLHLSGKSYQDLNDGGFFIDTNTGDVLVCDCDNVAADGDNFGIGGMPGFMAPEVVRGIAKPGVLTDRYSLAVVLFKLFFRGDPLEGSKVLQCVVMTEENDLIHYGRNPVFVYDPGDASNRPVKGVHDNVIKLWQIYPDYIRQAFTLSFTYGIQEPNARIIEKNWLQMLIQLKLDIIHCSCGRTAFSAAFEKKGEHTVFCQKCGSPIYMMSIKDFEIPLYPGAKLYACVTEKNSDDLTTVTGTVIENRLKKGLFGIKNMSRQTWKALYPDQSLRDVGPGKGVPIWKDLEVDFGGNVSGKIMI